MKKLFTLLVLMMAFGANVQAQELSEKEYREQYRQTLDSIRIFVNKADMYCGMIRAAWNEAIQKNTYNGKHVKDFNEAISLAQSEQTDIFKFMIQNYSVQKCIKSLNKYPVSMKYAFDEILLLGIKTDELYRMAISPEGSYNTYSKGSRDLYNDARKKLYELEMRYTD